MLAECSAHFLCRFYMTSLLWYRPIRDDSVHEVVFVYTFLTTLVKIRGIRCSLDIRAVLEIALDCVVDCKYPYKHKVVMFRAPK